MDSKLKEFISSQVSTYCDADPEILSSYVLALLNETKPTAEIKSSLHDQLKEFFEDETTGFIDRLYQFMSDNSTASIVEKEAEQPTRGPSNFDEDDDDEEDGDRSFKHRRHRHEDDEEEEHRKRPLPDQQDMEGQNKYRRSNTYRPLHRDDPKANDIPGGSAPPIHSNYRGSGYQGRNNGRGGTRRDFTSKPVCRDYNEKGYCVRGDLCPYEHGKDTIVYEEGGNPFNNPPNPMMPMMPPPFFDMFGKDAFSPENMAMMQSAMAALPPMNMPNPEELFKNMMQQPQRYQYNNRGGGPMRRGRGSGIRGRGGFNDRFINRQPRQQSTTLVIDNIPPEYCQMTTINDYFKKFGSIVNISLQPQKAFVQFSTHEEAEAARQSPDAIFDNRFVKVYWQKDTNEQSNTGGYKPNDGDGKHWNDRQKEGNAETVPTNEPDPTQIAAKAAELQRIKDEKQKKRQEQMQGILELQKQKEQLLQRQIDQQKELLAKLSDKSLTLAQKEDLLKSLKKIAADIDLSRKPAPVPAPAPEEEDSHHLQEKLAKLKAEAASLGISPDSTGQPYNAHGSGYYGRGWQQPPMMKRSLDNRPTKVMIKDIPQESNQDDLKKYFEQFGRLVSFENAQDGVIAHYSQRFEAEKAMAFGTNYPTGKLALSWYTSDPSV